MTVTAPAHHRVHDVYATMPTIDQTARAVEKINATTDAGLQLWALAALPQIIDQHIAEIHDNTWNDASDEELVTAWCEDAANAAENRYLVDAERLQVIANNLGHAAAHATKAGVTL